MLATQSYLWNTAPALGGATQNKEKVFYCAAAFIFIQSLNSCNQAAAERVHSKESILISSPFNSGMFTRHDFPASFFYFLNTRNNRGGWNTRRPRRFCCNLSGIKTPPNIKECCCRLLWEGTMHSCIICIPLPFSFFSAPTSDFSLYSFFLHF